MLILRSIFILIILIYPSIAIAESIPLSVILYEQNKEKLPKSNFDLNICNFVNKRGKFYATPHDRIYKECDLHNVYLAYGGWCKAGIEDSKGVHFSQALMPQIEVIEYIDGLVIYVNNYMKSHTESTQEDKQAVIEFIHNIPDAFDIRGKNLPLWPTEWEKFIPLKKAE